MPELPVVRIFEHMSLRTEHESNRSITRLILASGSPRRRELFNRFWGEQGYTVLIPDFDEQAVVDEYMRLNHSDPDELAKHISNGKIAAVKKYISDIEQSLVIAADTIVVVDDIILGKPKNRTEAAEMLKILSGKRHKVITAIALLANSSYNELQIVKRETTYVDFAIMNQSLIEWYLSTGEPLDKAGAYGIQGNGSALIKKIDGCYYNVMGLPVNRLMNMLLEAAESSPDFNFIYGLLPWS